MPTRELSIIKTPPFFTISVHTYRTTFSAASSRWAQGSSLNILFLTMQTEYYCLWQLVRLFSTAVSVTSGIISSIKHSNSYPDLHDRWDIHDAMEWWWVEPHKISITTVSFCSFFYSPGLFRQDPDSFVSSTKPFFSFITSYIPPNQLYGYTINYNTVPTSTILYICLFSALVSSVTQILLTGLTLKGK